MSVHSTKIQNDQANFKDIQGQEKSKQKENLILIDNHYE